MTGFPKLWAKIMNKGALPADVTPTHSGTVSQVLPAI